MLAEPADGREEFRGWRKSDGRNGSVAASGAYAPRGGPTIAFLSAAQRSMTPSNAVYTQHGPHDNSAKRSSKHRCVLVYIAATSASYHAVPLTHLR